MNEMDYYLTYGCVAEFLNDTSLWFEPITDEIDGFVLRGAAAEIRQVWASEANANWTPCSEGLPECHLIRDIFKRPQCYMSDPVLVTVKSKECDGTHYYVGTDYMSGKTEDKIDWVMTCGYGGSAVYHQEIIAWMPKPEPYKEVKE